MTGVRRPAALIALAIGSAQVAVAAALVASGTVAIAPPPPAWIAAALIAGYALFVALNPRAARAKELGAWRPRAIALKLALLGAIACSEEIIWRGLVITRLEPYTGIAFAVAIATAAFATMHVYGQGWTGLRTHAATGLAFGLLFVLSGSLLTPLVAHLAYNAAVIAADEDRRAQRAKAGAA
jgi:membrane protease YdiL (CAAX protease family)